MVFRPQRIIVLTVLLPVGCLKNAAPARAKGTTGTQKENT
jgi:hypothetical protein